MVRLAIDILENVRRDSGAVIVRGSDNTITGLNFAGNDDETIANPIF